MVLKNILLKGKHHRPIVTDVHYTKNKTAKPIVIFSHGYKGYKDWGAWNLMAQDFAKSDYFFVKFNFSYNGGTSEQPIDFPDLEAFGKNTFTIELDDLQQVIDWVLSNEEFSDEINPNDITLIGHSRGGGLSCLKTAKEPRIKNVITWSGVSDFAARFPTGFKLFWWRVKGKAYVYNKRTKQKMPHYYSIYKDFKNNEAEQTIKTAIQNINANHLIIQGTDDPVVKPIEAENMHQWNPKSKLVMIDNMNHALGNSQPWLEKQMPEDLIKVIKSSKEFIKQA